MSNSETRLEKWARRAYEILLRRGDNSRDVFQAWRFAKARRSWLKKGTLKYALWTKVMDVCDENK